MQLDPAALLLLRQTGSCEFKLPETLFDRDFPGHYFRRVKSVSISVPCVVGPYTSVSGTLTLLNNRIRTKATGDQYAEQEDTDDPRFVRDHVRLQSIATSSAQNDSGMFELNFRDERYLPSEGTGAISQWRFELPADFRQFDYNTISEMILHVRYTAREGGAALRTKAVTDLKRRLASAESRLVEMFSVRHEFPNEWHRFLQPSPGDTRTLTLKVSKERFPYFARRGDEEVTNVEILLAPSAPADVGKIELAFVEQPTRRTVASVTLRSEASAPGEAPGFGHNGVLDVKLRETDDEWRITLPVTRGGELQELEDILLLCSYTLKLDGHA